MNKRNWLTGRLLAHRGMTLPELLVSSAILVVVATGLLLGYLQAFELQAVAQSVSVATKLAASKIEQIRATPYTQIKATFDQVPFNVTGINGKGVSYVNDSNAKLLLITISISWKQPRGRIYGEDKDLNGLMASGENVFGDNMLHSPVMLSTKIFKP